MARSQRVPKVCPPRFASEINMVSPQLIENMETGHYAKVYLGSSPRPFCPYGRTDDLSAIIDTIDKAQKFVYVSVADYVPMRIFGEREFWPFIDDRLRIGTINSQKSMCYVFIAFVWPHS